MFQKPEIPTTEILPAVSVIDAILLFRRFGVDVTGKAPDEINAARRDLLHKHHPDRGGDLDTAQSINAAYDLLKHGVPKYRGTVVGLRSFRRAHRKRRDQVAALKLCYPDHPEWAWAGHSGDAPSPPVLRSHDFTDLNFIKKSMWELSGQADTEYTIWGFDGQHFRGHVTVFGAHKIFDYMADAMIMWLARGSHCCECRAVFVHEEESDDLYLIYADRKYYGASPLRIKQCACNRDPEDDPAFLRRVPEMLDRLRESLVA